VTVYRTRRRTANDLGSAFTFGGRVPTTVGILLVAILASSVLAWVTGASELAALWPSGIFPGFQLWRLVTWAFVQDHPFTLIFGGLVLYQFGAQLAYTWGERRLLTVFMGLAVGAAAITTAVAVFWRPANAGYLGVWPVVLGLILMWSMIYADQQVNIWGVLPLSGRNLGLLIVFGTVLYALWAGAGPMVPHFAALGIAWVLSRGRLPTRRWKAQLRDWWSEREFRRRSKHLTVVRKNGSGGEPPRWMN
jgi:membrane associated rhomboid family serine protease